MKPARSFLPALFLAACCGETALSACDDSSGPALPGLNDTFDASTSHVAAPDGGATAPDADAAPSLEAGEPTTYLETTLTLELELALPALADAASPPARAMDLPLDEGGGALEDGPMVDDGSPPVQPPETDDGQVADLDASAPDASEPTGAEALDSASYDAPGPAETGDGEVRADAGADAAALVEGGAGPVATLTITARDGVTPVVTDLWLYTLDDSGQATPLGGFSSTANRRSQRLMLPATIGGRPSGLSPADDGRVNGLMTNTNRGSLEQGAFVSSVTGTVVVTLPSIPQSPILVVAGVEDQRYAGAAVIQPDGTPGVVPAGFGQPETHTRRSFEQDVAPILKANCSACHNATGPDNANFYLVTGSRDDLVNDNFALKEQTLKCQTSYPDGGTTFAACVQAVTQAQYLVEPGAPAVSDLLQRARPDEDAGTSTLGLAWYGSRGARYSTSYGDRRMPSTTISTNASDWTNQSTYFDLNPGQYQILFDWVAQGAPQ